MPISRAYSYRVVVATDRHSGEIVASLPSLNWTADFGASVEEALVNLRRLAKGFVQVLQDEGEPVPPSDPPAEGLFLTLLVRPLRTEAP